MENKGRLAETYQKCVQFNKYLFALNRLKDCVLFNLIKIIMLHFSSLFLCVIHSCFEFGFLNISGIFLCVCHLLPSNGTREHFMFGVQVVRSRESATKQQQRYCLCHEVTKANHLVS